MTIVIGAARFCVASMTRREEMAYYVLWLTLVSSNPNVQSASPFVSQAFKTLGECTRVAHLIQQEQEGNPKVKLEPTCSTSFAAAPVYPGSGF